MTYSTIVCYILHEISFTKMLVTSLIFHQNQKKKFFYEAQTAGNLLRKMEFLSEAPKKRKKRKKRKKKAKN